MVTDTERNELIFALAWLFKAFYAKEYKTTEQFDAMDATAELFPGTLKKNERLLRLSNS